MKKKLISFISLPLVCSGFGCGSPPSYDLLITNIRVFDGLENTILDDRTICISDGLIREVIPASERRVGSEVIDGAGRLVTAGLIDTHVHPVSALANGKYAVLPDTLAPDSSARYRQHLTGDYLRYGTTSLLMMGHPPAWNEMMLAWSADRRADQVDVLTCGGALATEDGHGYPGHHRLAGPDSARQVIDAYYDQGIRHLKLYWRLRQPEIGTVVERANNLDMRLYAHSGGFFDTTQRNIAANLALGVRHFEHIAILPANVFGQEDWTAVRAAFDTNFGELEGDPNQLSLLYILETFRRADTHRRAELDRLIAQMAAAHCTISTTIGWVYKAYHATFFGPADIRGLSEEQFRRCEENFALFMDCVRHIHASGIPIRIGTDTNPGGQLVLLEMQLLARLGLPIEDVLRIATRNGAEALGISDSTGIITSGRYADLVIWDEDPTLTPDHLSAGMQVVKGGHLVPR